MSKWAQQPLLLNDDFIWKTDLSCLAWDALIAQYRAHPLQSASWGNAKARCENKIDYRWVAYDKHNNERPVFMVRFEERYYTQFIKIAWAPKGPVVIDSRLKKQVFQSFLKKLKKDKFLFFLAFPWEERVHNNLNHHLPQTIWVDLTDGVEKLWQKLDGKFRYSVKRAKQLGVTIDQSKVHTDINDFYDLCKSISMKKKFHLTLSKEILHFLLVNDNNDDVEKCLFIARYQSQVCGGAFIIRCGENIHYLWGGTNRGVSGCMQVGELLQWSVMEWAMQKGCRLYDLEGIDVKKNPSVYAFKKKLKGRIVALPSVHLYPLNFFSKLMQPIGKVILGSMSR